MLHFVYVWLDTYIYICVSCMYKHIPIPTYGILYMIGDISIRANEYEDAMAEMVSLYCVWEQRGKQKWRSVRHAKMFDFDLIYLTQKAAQTCSEIQRLTGNHAQGQQKQQPQQQQLTINRRLPPLTAARFSLPTNLSAPGKHIYTWQCPFWLSTVFR